MEVFHIALLSSAFLCSVVAGFLFAYAVVIMPGIASLEDKDFLRTFQVTDRIIQNNHPLFMLAWVGSIVAVSDHVAPTVVRGEQDGSHSPDISELRVAVELPRGMG